MTDEIVGVIEDPIDTYTDNCIRDLILDAWDNSPFNVSVLHRYGDYSYAREEISDNSNPNELEAGDTQLGIFNMNMLVKINAIVGDDAIFVIEITNITRGRASEPPMCLPGTAFPDNSETLSMIQKIIKTHHTHMLQLGKVSNPVVEYIKKIQRNTYARTI
jgi:hypothetical protein